MANNHSPQMIIAMACFEKQRRTSSERRMRLDSGNRLTFAERTDYIDMCLCQNRLRNEVRDGRRRLGRAGGCLGSGSSCCRVGRGLPEV